MAAVTDLAKRFRASTITFGDETETGGIIDAVDRVPEEVRRAA